MTKLTKAMTLLERPDTLFIVESGSMFNSDPVEQTRLWLESRLNIPAKCGICLKAMLEPTFVLKDKKMLVSGHLAFHYLTVHGLPLEIIGMVVSKVLYEKLVEAFGEPDECLPSF